MNKVYLSNPKPPTRWTPPVPVHVIEASARTITELPLAANEPLLPLSARPRAGSSRVLVAGTLDTKGQELRFIYNTLKTEGIAAHLVDLSTSGKPSGAEVPPHVLAGFHPRGAVGVFTNDRGTAVAGMTLAFERWMAAQDDVAGVISAGGSGGCLLYTSDAADDW